jgi:hypothetical protein
MALKPSIGGPMLVYGLLRRQWTAAAVAVAAGTASFFLGLLPMLAEGRPLGWIPVWLHNVATSDAVAQGLNRYMMLHIVVILQAFVADLTFARWLGLAFAAAPLGLWAWLAYRKREGSDQLCLASIGNLLALVAVYHRPYDAAFLLMPAAWALGALDRPNDRRYAAAVLAMLLPFVLFNWSRVLFEMFERGYLPPALADAWWVRLFVMPHETWLILGIAAVLLAWALDASRREPRPRPADSAA